MADLTQPAKLEDLLAHAEWLRALARRLVRNGEVASDVEQQTWLEAIERPPRDASAPRNWLAQVLRNIVRQERRSEGARRDREARAARPATVAGGEEAVDRAQALRALIEGVLELDEPCRSTLLLRYQDGLSTEEIADVQHVPSSTVRGRIGRGLEQLRQRFQRSHGDAWSAWLIPLVHPSATSAAATAGAGAFGASVAAFTSMATIKLVSATLAVLGAGAALWWTFSDTAPTLSTSTPAVSPARGSPALAEPADAPTSTRAVAEAPAKETTAGAPAIPGQRGSLLVSVKWKSDGSPASDVIVRIHAWGESSSFAFATSRPTDAQGRANFNDVASGSVIVETDRADGESVQVRGGEQTKVALEIPAGILVRGKVVDSSGRSVRFARIWLSQYGNRDSGEEVCTTDALGRFTLRDVGEARSVAARAAGLAPSFSTSISGKPGDQVDVVLEMPANGGEMRGTVQTPDGTRVAGAAVLVGCDGASWRPTQDGAAGYSEPPQHLTTDEHGEFVATGIAAGRTNVECRARGTAPMSRGVEVAAEGVTRVAIELQPGAAIAGVVRGADGKPAGKVFIGLGDYGKFASSNTTSAADGSFLLDGLAAGQAVIRLRGQDQGDADAALTLVAAETARLELQLKKRGIVAGRVIDEDGSPIVGWTVAAITADHPGLQYRSSTTDSAGNFAIENWPEKATALEVREPGALMGPPALILPSVIIGSTDLVLTVAATSRATAFVIGRLRGPEGEVVPDASLGWGTPGILNSQYGSELSATTGDFRAGPMPEGRYEFRAWSPTRGRFELTERNVSAGETLDLGELRFPAPARVRVKLTAPKDLTEALDAKQLNVRLTDSARIGIARIEIDQKLEGRSPPLAAGRYTIEVSSTNLRGSSTPIELHAGQELDVEVQLERATSRSLLVIWASGVPPTEEFDLTLTDSKGQVSLQVQLPADESGVTGVGIPGLVLGTYWVDVKTTDGRSGRVSFDVTDLTAVDQQRPSGGRIEVQVH